MNDLLRKKDVTESVGAAKTTVHDWLQEFSPFIPKIKNGQTVYYKPQAVEVLRAIKNMREQGLDKTQIALELPKMGFSIDSDETVNNVSKVQERFEQSENRDALMTVMQTMAKTMERMTELEKEIDETKKRQIEQEQKNNELGKQIEEQQRYIKKGLEERDRKLMESLREIQEVKKKVAAAEEERKNKGFFARIFNK
jgi:DNA-binding transcriptional MerR regulator